MRNIITYNINYSSRTVDQYQEFDWTHRRSHVRDTLDLAAQKNWASTIFCLQEMRPEYMADAESWFSGTHDCFTQRTNPEKHLYAMTAVPKDLKPSLFTLPHLAGADRQPFLGVELGKNKTLVINCHLPMDQTWNQKYVQHLIDRVRDANLTNVASIIENFIICGDFNTFPDAGGFALVNQIVAHCGVCELTHFMVNESGTRQLTTFKPFEYDVIPKGLPPYNLDHIFVSPDLMAQSPPICYAEYQPLIANGKCYGASDHFCICAHIEI